MSKCFSCCFFGEGIKGGLEGIIVSCLVSGHWKLKGDAKTSLCSHFFFMNWPDCMMSLIRLSELLFVTFMRP